LYQFHLALLNYNLDEERFNLHIDQAKTVRDSITSTILPWNEPAATVDLTDVIRSMKQQYIDTFGDPDDPEFQKKIASTVAELNNRGKAK